jgi:hypothetical protein
MLWRDIDERYRSRRGQSQQEPKRLEVHEMEDFIVQFSRQLSGTVLFLDAPNESKQSSGILQSLLQIAQKGASLRIVMSSTEELGTNLSSPLVTIVTMEKEKTAGDIANYIEAWLRYNPNLCDLPISLKEDIKSTLQERADGMYHILFHRFQL